MINNNCELYVDLIYKDLLPIHLNEYISVRPNKINQETIDMIKYYEKDIATNENDHKGRDIEWEDVTKRYIINKHIEPYQRPYMIIVWEGLKYKLDVNSTFRIVSLKDLELLYSNIKVSYPNKKTTTKKKTYPRKYSYKFYRNRKTAIYANLKKDHSLKNDIDLDLQDMGINYKVKLNKESRKYKNPIWSDYDYYDVKYVDKSWKTNSKQKRQWAKHKPYNVEIKTKNICTNYYANTPVETIKLNNGVYTQGLREIQEGDLVYAPYNPSEGVYKIKKRDDTLIVYRNNCYDYIDNMPDLKLITDSRVKWNDWEDFEFGNYQLGNYCWINFPKHLQPYFPTY